MDFDYSDEQRHLREEAHRFLADACPTAAARTVMDDDITQFDRALWQRITAQGWLGVTIPQTFGGLGLGPVDLGALAEAVGAALAPAPFGSTLYLLAEAIGRFGSEKQQSRWLPGIAQGVTIGCGALFSAGAPVVVSSGRISGAFRPVVDGGIADLAVIAACDEAGSGLFVADLAADGVERRRLEAVDRSLDVAAIEFRDAPVERLARSDTRSRDELMARAAAAYAFEQVGGADRCFALTIEYVKSRDAFGGPVGRFQAVKHKLADLYTTNQIARSHAYHGAWAAEAAPALLAQAAAAARVAASEAYWQAAKEMIHFHGAIGFTWEHDAHLFYRRAHHLSLNLGGPLEWKSRLYRALAAAP